MRYTSTAIAALILVAVCTGSAHAQMDLVLISDQGNSADTNGWGAVARRFWIGRYEVTNDQYVEFLNAVADADPNGLFSESMTDSDRGGIVRSGTAGSFTYTLKLHFADKPANFVSWPDVARFCNWMHNGQPTGVQSPATTENGAYDMSLAIDAIVRRPGSLWFVPRHDEWYKAAFYDPFDPAADGNGTTDYWLYPTQSDGVPGTASSDATGDVTNPGPQIANVDKGADWNGENGNVTTVGSCAAPSPWNAFDMGGNVNEWTETLDLPIPANPPSQPNPLPTRTIRGGDFSNSVALLGSPDFLAPGLNMVAEGANIGFRVATIARPGDNTGDGFVDVDDLVNVILEWGPCPPAPCNTDSNNDGTVDVDDLIDVILFWS